MKRIISSLVIVCLTVSQATIGFAAYDMLPPTMLSKNNKDAAITIDQAINSQTQSLLLKNKPTYLNWYETLPDLNSNSSAYINKEETQESQYLLRMIRSTIPTINDMWVQAQVDSLVGSLSQKANMPPVRSIAIIADPQINAFAAPGGMMGINSGLIMQLKEPDQVAAVIAHELSHIKQKHFQRRQEDLKNLQWMTVAAMLAGLVLTQANGNLGAAVMTGSQAYNASKTLSYSRSAEMEADRMGMQVLKSAGYSPAAMAQTFEIMDKKSHISSNIPGFLLTHPLSQDRVTEARLFEQNLSNLAADKNTVLSDETFKLLQDRLQLLGQYQDESTIKATASFDPFKRLQLAQVQIEQGKLKDAIGNLNWVISQKPEWDLPKYLLFQTYINTNQPQKALQTIEPAYRIAPENALLRALMASYFMANKQPNKAVELLQKLTTEYPTNVMYWRELAKAYHSMLPQTTNSKAQFSYAKAQELYWEGKLVPAKIQLQQAIRLADNEGQKYQYQTRLNEINDLEKKYSKKYNS